jgi:hypothetical protein
MIRTVLALAQMNMAGRVMEMQNEIPPEKLPAPVRMSGIGNAHMEITATPEAQMWFDQGLNLLQDFWERVRPCVRTGCAGRPPMCHVLLGPLQR